MSTHRSFISNSYGFVSDEMSRIDTELTVHQRDTGKTEEVSGEDDDKKKLVLFITVVSARGLAAAARGVGARDLATSLLARAAAYPLRENKDDGERRYPLKYFVRSNVTKTSCILC